MANIKFKKSDKFNVGSLYMLEENHKVENVKLVKNINSHAQY